MKRSNFWILYKQQFRRIYTWLAYQFLIVLVIVCVFMVGEWGLTSLWLGLAGFAWTAVSIGLIGDPNAIPDRQDSEDEEITGMGTFIG